MSENKPILVTGSHRSGSTWVGKMMSLSKDIGYIHEPLLHHNEFSLCSDKLQYYYPFIDSHNEELYVEDVKKSINHHINYIKPFKSHLQNGSLQYYAKTVVESLQSRFTSKRALIKDPLAFFSVEWLYKNFNTKPILIIRHPAAFVASVIKQNWQQPFSHFRDQKELFEQKLKPFQDDIIKFSVNTYPLIDQAILTWNMIHYQMHNYMNDHNDWYFTRHENLSASPVEEFEKLYKYSDIPFTDKIKDKIKIYSGLSEEKVIFNKKVQRNSRDNILAWKKRLTEDEIEYIYARVKEFSKHFYSDDEW